MERRSYDQWRGRAQPGQSHHGGHMRQDNRHFINITDSVDEKSYWFVGKKLLICGKKVTDLWEKSYWFVGKKLLICGKKVTDSVDEKSYWFVGKKLLICGKKVTDLWEKGYWFRRWKKLLIS